MRAVAKTNIRVGGSAWTPKSEQNMKLWLRSDRDVLVVAGEMYWTDQSGLGHHVDSLSSTVNPTLVLSDPNYNGHPIVDCAGGAWLSSPTDWTDTVPTPTSWYIAGQTGAGADANAMLIDGTSGGARQAAYEGGTDLIAYAGSAISATSAKGAKHIYSVVFGTLGAIYKDSLTASATGTTGTYSVKGIILSAYAGVNLGCCKFAEVIMYSGIHSDSQRFRVMTYLAQRYAHALV